MNSFGQNWLPFVAAALVLSLSTPILAQDEYQSGSNFIECFHCSGSLEYCSQRASSDPSSPNCLKPCDSSIYRDPICLLTYTNGGQRVYQTCIERSQCSNKTLSSYEQKCCSGNRCNCVGENCEGGSLLDASGGGGGSFGAGKCMRCFDCKQSVGTSVACPSPGDVCATQRYFGNQDTAQQSRIDRFCAPSCPPKSDTEYTVSCCSTTNCNTDRLDFSDSGVQLATNGVFIVLATIAMLLF